MEVHTLDAPGKPDTPSSISKDVKDKLSSIRQAKRTLRGFLNNRNDDGSKLSVDQLSEGTLEGEREEPPGRRHPPPRRGVLRRGVLERLLPPRGGRLRREGAHHQVRRHRGRVHPKGNLRRAQGRGERGRDHLREVVRRRRRGPPGAGRGGAGPQRPVLRRGAGGDRRACGSLRSRDTPPGAEGIVPVVSVGEVRPRCGGSPFERVGRRRDVGRCSHLQGIRGAAEERRLPGSARSVGLRRKIWIRPHRSRLQGGRVQFRPHRSRLQGGRVQFSGEVFSLRGGRLVSRNVEDEFWAAPRNQWFFADGSTETAWVHADRRVKGFTIDSEDRLATSYVFNVERTPKRKISAEKRIYHGDVNLMRLGSNLAYLKDGVIQEWAISEANRHDGIRRMCSHDDENEWDDDEILDLMDVEESSCYRAESSAGIKPDSVRDVDVHTPSSVGYLADDQVSFAHEGSSAIKIYDCELREVSRLEGFDREEVEIVQRPTFEHAGDKNAFVASDYNHVKIFDLRARSCSITINQKCEYSIPVYCDNDKFICNRLRYGSESMIWDLRAQKPLYSLPTPGDVEWAPKSENGPPMLITSSGLRFQYGLDPVKNKKVLEEAAEYWGIARG